MNHLIGKCSLCGGRVVMSDTWMSVDEQIPHCESCGAREKDRGRVIQMERAQQESTTEQTRQQELADAMRQRRARSIP